MQFRAEQPLLFNQPLRYLEAPQTQIQLDLLKTFCLRNTVALIPDTGPTAVHRQVQDIVINSWPLSIDKKQLMTERLAVFYEPWCFLEVQFKIPPNGSKIPEIVTVDVLGADRQGRVYVIEIGSTHKVNQLTRQIRIIETLFSPIKPFGLTLKYAQQGETLSFKIHHKPKLDY
jgi:hypothetical protein